MGEWVWQGFSKVFWRATAPSRAPRERGRGKVAATRVRSPLAWAKTSRRRATSHSVGAVSTASRSAMDYLACWKL